jgi:hypothetical protein
LADSGDAAILAKQVGRVALFRGYDIGMLDQK